MASTGRETDPWGLVRSRITGESGCETDNDRSAFRRAARPGGGPRPTGRSSPRRPSPAIAALQPTEIDEILWAPGQPLHSQQRGARDEGQRAAGKDDLDAIV